MCLKLCMEKVSMNRAIHRMQWAAVLFLWPQYLLQPRCLWKLLQSDPCTNIYPHKLHSKAGQWLLLYEENWLYKSTLKYWMWKHLDIIMGDHTHPNTHVYNWSFITSSSKDSVNHYLHKKRKNTNTVIRSKCSQVNHTFQKVTVSYNRSILFSPGQALGFHYTSYDN